jgi:signal transduction histidine kinase
MRAEASAAVLEADPVAARALLDELASEVAVAIADVRRLVDGLRPPAIDELGLLAAIDQQARRLEGGGVEAVRISVAGVPSPLPELPAAVEVAAYRIAIEAMTNAAIHSQARRCEVRIAEQDGLRIEVDDDGVGLPAGTPSGVGLTSMRERAAELGGRLSIHAEPGRGTRVEAWLPL